MTRTAPNEDDVVYLIWRDKVTGRPVIAGLIKCIN